MSLKKSMGIERIFVDRTAKKASLTRRILKELKGLPVTIVTNKKAFLRSLGTLPLGTGKKSLWLTRFKGDFLKPCPATGTEYLCCRYRVLTPKPIARWIALTAFSRTI